MAGAGRRSGWSEVYAKTPVGAARTHPTLTNQNFRIDAAPGRWGLVVDAPLVGGVLCVWDLV